VEAAVAQRRDISSFIETNGTLEAENEVDLVARIAAPLVRLNVEEGDRVRQGDLLARLDDTEIRAKAAVSKANLDESKLAFERAARLHDANLISPEDYEQALTRFETSRAQFESDQIELGYTEIRAPFSGLIIHRYVNFAEQVSPNSRLFRISDFDPLLCPIQIPERDLSRVRIDQSAYLTLEAWADDQFSAKVLRISPVVDATTGTVKVTLALESEDRLRPGMFASVYLKTETRSDALVVPKSALSLDSIGDTVYVVADGEAQRREVKLGFQEGDFVEVVKGVELGESIVTVGQDGLSDGTPVRVVSGGETESTSDSVSSSTSAPSEIQRDSGGSQGRPGGRPDFSKMSPEQLERVKEMMKARGLTDAQIEERIRGPHGPAEDSGE
jgi:RND family efflux transporter MFP subunit